MKVTRGALMLWLCAASLPAAAEGNVLAQSNFDGDSEGWTALGSGGSPSWAIHSGVSVQYQSGGGNPGGHITVQDPDNEWSYFSAPLAFLGNQSAAYGGRLSFDSRLVSAPGGTPANEAEVVLRGAGLTLVHEATASLSATWTSFDIPLMPGSWRVDDTFSGALATDAQLQSVLGALSALWINAEYITPVVETVALDNVRLLAPVPEPRQAVLMSAGLCLLVWAARRTRSPGASGHDRRERAAIAG